MEENLYLIYFAGILALGITAQWLAWRLHLPSILLLLGFGFLAGLLPQGPDEIIGIKVLFPFEKCMCIVQPTYRARQHDACLQDLSSH